MSNDKLYKDNSNSFEEAIKKATKKKSIIFDFSKTWVAYLMLAILVASSFLVKNIVADNIHSELETEFEKSYSSVITRFNNYYDRLEQVIKSTQGLYYENVDVVRDYFELNGAVLVKTSSSIICMTYAPKVTNAQWANFQHSALSQGYNRYNLNPAGQREYYYPVIHIVDFETNKDRLAFDYAANPILKTAIELARDEDIITSTEIFDLRNHSPSFALIAPVYHRDANKSYLQNHQNSFLGSVVMEIDAANFFTNAIKGSDDSSHKDIFASDTSIVFFVLDGDSKDGENIVFKSANFELLESKKYVPRLSTIVPFKIANRTLNVNFLTLPNFDNTLKAQLPTMAFLGALFISLIAFILVIVLLTQKARAEEIAEKMTASQKRILDTSRDIIAVLSMDGKWLSMNIASNVLLGIESGKIIGTNIVDYFFDEKDKAIWNGIIESKRENTRVDIRIKSNNKDEFIWISWSFTCPHNENLIYAIGRNVSLEKQAAEEIKFRAKQTELSQCYEKEASTSKTYMMIQLSHEMRNQLTSVMGYLQLITNKVYDSEEELLLYATNANESSEHAFEFIQSAAEATIGDSDTFSRMAVHTVEDTIVPIFNDFKKANSSIKANMFFAEHGKDAHIVVDISILNEVWSNLFAIFSASSNLDVDVTVTANENKMEGITEVVLEVPAYDDFLRLISIYNSDSDNIVERLREDTNDILINIAKTASLVKRMMGTFSLDIIDDKDVYVFISLPLVSRLRNE